MAVFGDYRSCLSASFAFTVVCISVLVLRKTNPGLHRPFRTPFYPLVPILGAGTSLLQMAGLPLGTWARFIIWFAIGMSIYFLYSRRMNRQI